MHQNTIWHIQEVEEADKLIARSSRTLHIYIHTQGALGLSIRTGGGGGGGGEEELVIVIHIQMEVIALEP